jgi:hypothetical protein
MATVLDYSAGRPGGAAIKEAGHPGVQRYAGTPGRTKNLTRGEFQDLDAHGIGVGVVYENGAGDALTGRAGGGNSARLMNADLANIGFPAGRPRYFAVDQDITSQMPAVLDYFRGVGDELPVSQIGVYGEADVLDAVFDAGLGTYGWQTKAWSKGRLAKKWHLLQLLGTVVVGGVGCDESTIHAADWGQHNVGGHMAPPENPNGILDNNDVGLVMAFGNQADVQPDPKHLNYVSLGSVLRADPIALLRDIQTRQVAMQAAVAAIASNPGITPAQIEAAIGAAVAEHIQVTLAVTPTA